MSRVDASTVVFIDASCLVAAASSPSGGSAFIVSLCSRRYVIPAVSQGVIEEAQRNLARKFPRRCLQLHLRQIAELHPILARHTLQETALPQPVGINTKDRHVVAAALDLGADFLITLDRPLIAEARLARLPTSVVTPWEFLNIFLPDHPNFDSLRSEE